MKFANFKGKWFIQDAAKGGWVNADGKVETVSAGAAFYPDLTSATKAGFKPSTSQGASITTLPPADPKK